MHDPKVTTYSESLIQHGQLPLAAYKVSFLQLTFLFLLGLAPAKDCEDLSVRVKLHTDLQDMHGEQPESQAFPTSLSEGTSVVSRPVLVPCKEKQ